MSLPTRTRHRGDWAALILCSVRTPPSVLLRHRIHRPPRVPLAEASRAHVTICPVRFVKGSPTSDGSDMQRSPIATALRRPLASAPSTCNHRSADRVSTRVRHRALARSYVRKDLKKVMQDFEGKFTDQNKIIFVGDMNVKSGTCNVCSATCSSCMHRIATEMESAGDFGSSDNIFGRKEADSCSFVSAKCRSCNDLQIAASETSNLLSGSSSHDSYSENADSKTVRKSTAYDTYEDFDIPLKVSTVEAVEEDKVLRSGSASIGNGTSCSFCRPDFQNGASAREQYVSGCHGNNDSCITGGRDSNPLLTIDNLKLDMRDTQCSSVSTCKLGAKETEVLIQVEATREYDGGHMDAGWGNSGKLRTFPGESFCKKSDSLGLHSKSDLTEPSTRMNISPRSNLHFHSQSGHISSHNADSKDMEAYQPCQVLGEPCKCLIVDDESSYQGLLAVGGDHALKTIMLPNNEASKAIQIRSDISSGKFMNKDGCFKSASGFGSSECNLHESGKPQQSLIHGQVSESDCMLYDVSASVIIL
ncbi:hypothetical protein BHM03_00014542 [Ensete ventricosum]|nr:hypothetical protein BHM03_00014542 [Ensete ventricosum]